MPKIRLFQTQTIGAKLFLAVMGGAFVGLGSTAFLYNQVLEHQSEVQIRDSLSTEVNSIESQLTPVKQTLLNLGGMVQQLKETGNQDPEAYQDIALDFFLKRPPLVMGLSMQQYPYGIFKNRKWYSTYFYKDQKIAGQIGKHLPFPNSSILFSDLVKDDNAPNQPYFKDTLAVQYDTWLEPYDWYNISMTTANHLLFDYRGRLEGFVSMDVNITQLSKTIHSSVFNNTGYFVVITQQGTLVSYPPDTSKVRQNYRKIESLAKIWPELQKGSSGLFESHGQYWAYRRIPSTRWIMLAVVPQSVVFWPVLTTSLSGVCIAAIVLALVVLVFVQYLDRRLKPVLNECYRLAADDTQRTLRLDRDFDEKSNASQNWTFDFKKADELEVLQQVFWRVSSQLKASFDDLEQRVAERTAQLEAAKQFAEHAKEIAVAANQYKSQFFANMSHELRTPLNAILGYAQIMTRDTSLSSKQQSHLQIIGRSGEHLLSLINDVLDMSKIESGQIILYPNDFDLLKLLSFIKEMLCEGAKYKGLELVFDYAKELPQHINADKKKLRQVLLNLLGNAIKFTDSGFVSLRVHVVPQSSIQVVQTEDLFIEFIVEDSGPGIASNELKTLFEPFVQAESGRKTEQGTGLGLAISQKFVELMGGNLFVESILGQGSIFKFTIPVKLSSAVTTQTPQPVRRVIGLAESQTRYRILVVDNVLQNRQLLISLLEPIGFEIKEAVNGEDAIACWEMWKPHLIWMDMRMPVLDGFEATRQIKSKFQDKETTIIALTASVLGDDVSEIYAAGCDDFVSKPFLENEIFDKMGQYLNVQYEYQSLDVDQLEVSEVLNKDAFADMPSTWIKLLYDASAGLDVEKLTSLIEQIPDEKSALRKSLQFRVDNFEFEQIMEVIQ